MITAEDYLWDLNRPASKSASAALQRFGLVRSVIREVTLSSSVSETTPAEKLPFSVASDLVGKWRNMCVGGGMARSQGRQQCEQSGGYLIHRLRQPSIVTSS